jgi:hypothetical protein
MIYFPAMTAKRLVRGIALFGVCALAVKANHGMREIILALKLPLFLDTVFTCALTFAWGSVPGIIVAGLTVLDLIFLRGQESWPFQLCSLAEVFLICLLRPGKTRRFSPPTGARAPEKTASFINTFAALLILYVACCAAVSVLGGIIDYVLYDTLVENKTYYSPEDAFKIGLLRSGPPVIITNILSRIPINIVDRFITIFGGFALSLPVRKKNWAAWGGAKI